MLDYDEFLERGICFPMWMHVIDVGASLRGARMVFLSGLMRSTLPEHDVRDSFCFLTSGRAAKPAYQAFVATATPEVWNFSGSIPFLLIPGRSTLEAKAALHDGIRGPRGPRGPWLLNRGVLEFLNGQARLPSAVRSDPLRLVRGLVGTYTSRGAARP
ncbi:hypothetical protein R1flu_010362 [Riccia fluitans]|uniref:Uncharacterized protein n=1 Tax=Riccia fluitans TaxID=41844 RepID=A0ABD1Z4X7_9MARC